MAARSDAARAEVVARRELLRHEVDRLEAAGRAAVDIPAKVRKAPAKTAGLAAGTAFLVLGGPQRLFRRVRRRVRGPEADWPKSLLPEDVEKRLRTLGDDGRRVRASLEREFADYLEKNREARESRELGKVAVSLAGNVLKPLSTRVGRQLAEQLFQPESGSFGEAVERIRARREAGKGAGPGVTTTPDAGRPASGVSGGAGAVGSRTGQDQASAAGEVRPAPKGR